MIKRLKRKFIATTMGCVLAVFLILLVALNVFFSYNLTSTSDSLLNLLVGDKVMRLDDGTDRFGDDNMKQPPDIPEQDGSAPSDAPTGEVPADDARDLNPVPETKNSMRYFIVEYDENWNITSLDMEQITSVTEDEATVMAQNAVNAADGKIRWESNYRYVSAQTADGYKTVFLNCELVRYSLNSLRLYSFLIAIISYMILFFIVLMISGRVIKPISDSYEKQKRFITDAGHELKTPLTIISANNELQELNGFASENTKAINDEIAHMTDLVNQLVSLARYDEEKMQITSSQFSLSEAVIDTASAFLGVAEKGGKKLTVNASPDIMFDGDEGMIRRLVSILMDNAVKYCDDSGEIIVKLTKGKHIELSVSNTYAAVKSVSLEQLFDRFYREDKARTSGNGYGLGLSIAKAVVISHHGNIKAKCSGENTIEFSVIF